MLSRRGPGFSSTISVLIAGTACLDLISGVKSESSVDVCPPIGGGQAAKGYNKYLLELGDFLYTPGWFLLR